MQEMKLGSSQIQSLSELALFDFTIKYQTGRPSGVFDILSCHPPNQDFHLKAKLRVLSRSHLSLVFLQDAHFIPQKYQDPRWTEIRNVMCWLCIVIYHRRGQHWKCCFSIQPSLICKCGRGTAERSDTRPGLSVCNSWNKA